MAKLSINLVTWNGANYLPFLFASLKRQIFKDWILNVFDNNSSDDTVKIIKAELDNLGVQHRLSLGENNLGFAAGHNQLFKQTDSEYVLLLNQDIELEPDCLAKLVAFLDHESAAAVSPRLMKWKDRLTIDSLGLRVLRSRRVVERLAGKIWTDFDEQTVNKLRSRQVEVFGVSASCALYRCELIRQALYDGQKLFTDSYFAYKEDVDLAYRLRQAGVGSYVLLDAVAYHVRSGEGAADLCDKKAVENKKNQSELVKYHSYKNHLATLYKNEYWQNFVLDWPWILWYEFKKFVYFLLFDRQILSSWRELRQSMVELKKQRRQIVKIRRLGWREIRMWWR